MSNFAWPSDAQCALSLTYDDAIPAHPNLVAPALELHGLRGTFYAVLRPSSDIFARPEAWAALAAAGHEIGNHSLFHPCRMPDSPFPWLDPAYNLCDYAPARLHDELAVANSILRLIDGRPDRTYGATCCHTTIGRAPHEQSMSPVLDSLFTAVRGNLTNRPEVPAKGINRLNVGCIGADGKSLDELIAIVESARTVGGWAVLCAHGVGPESHSLHLDINVHESFVAWLAQQRASVWTAPFRDVAASVFSDASAKLSR